MSTREILSRSVEVVAFIYAAFGGFLQNIAPPEEANARYAVGISSILALCVLLFISSVTKGQPKRKYKRRWLTAAGVLFAVAIAAAFAYRWNIDRLTFPFPPESRAAEYVAGTELTSLAKELLEESPGITTSELVDRSGGLAMRGRVWTEESIRVAKMTLSVNYVLLTLSLATVLFCLTEGILLQPQVGSQSGNDSHRQTAAQITGEK